MVMRYLVGLGDDLAPLRYRLLPTSGFVNMPQYEARPEGGPSPQPNPNPSPNP